MEIYLIRHTRTATLSGLCYGRTDVPLAESFTEDIAELMAKLPELKDDVQVISSPLSRCSRLAEALGYDVHIDARLEEIHFGEWENRRFDDLDPIQVKHWADNFVTVPPPGGESFSELCSRVGGFWEDLKAKQQFQSIVLITHAGVIRALLAQVLQLPLANAFKFRVDSGSVHKLQHVNGYTYIHYLNR